MYISIIKYWLRLNKLPNNRLIVDALDTNLDMQEMGIYTWTSLVKHILQESDFVEVWNTKEIPAQNTNKFINTLRNRLENKHTTLIRGLMHTDPQDKSKGQNKLRTYRKFKTDHKQEKYLTMLSDSRIRSSVSKMRLSSHNLMIEKGRHLNLNVEDRLCQKCNMDLVEDEFHSIMICTAFSHKRNILFDVLNKNVKDWIELNNENKFLLIMKANTQTTEIAEFIHTIIRYDIDKAEVC